MGRMYRDTETWNFFVGCLNECAYCVASFQRQLKRWGKANCDDCYHYKPHAHAERLKKFPRSPIVFAAGCSDVMYAPTELLEESLVVVRKHPTQTVLYQSRRPTTFSRIKVWPRNVMLGTTAETNRDIRHCGERPTPVSLAQPPLARLADLALVEHERKFVTIEPILDFDEGIFANVLLVLEPERVYVGYESHDFDFRAYDLREPSLAKTSHFIEILNEKLDVRLKLLREARWTEDLSSQRALQS